MYLQTLASILFSLIGWTLLHQAFPPQSTLVVWVAPLESVGPLWLDMSPGATRVSTIEVTLKCSFIPRGG